ncbi:MAG: hypothetical protein RMM53_13405, partial [Bacteroidia bacterium]|nr:hypothetical protein [Bacteroidia bacterium]MDW8335206.1 hypothetical protein [Bacteroidia bacterium]
GMRAEGQHRNFRRTHTTTISAFCELKTKQKRRNARIPNPPSNPKTRRPVAQPKNHAAVAGEPRTSI